MGFKNNAFSVAFHSKQPGNGYLDPKLFDAEKLISKEDLFVSEKIPEVLENISVVYLFRIFGLNTSPTEVFRMSLRTSWDSNNNPEISISKDVYSKAIDFLKNIVSLDDDETINSAIKLSGYSSYYWDHDITEDQVNPNDAAIKNVRIMVNRTIDFSKKFGLIKDPMHIEFASVVQSKKIFINFVDRHFLTYDVFWYIKPSSKKSEMNKVDTLLILIYYLFGVKSGDGRFLRIKKLGIFDPRSNSVYTLCLCKIPKETISKVEEQIIDWY